MDGAASGPLAMEVEENGTGFSIADSISKRCCSVRKLAQELLWLVSYACLKNFMRKKMKAIDFLTECFSEALSLSAGLLSSLVAYLPTSASALLLYYYTTVKSKFSWPSLNIKENKKN